MWLLDGNQPTLDRADTTATLDGENTPLAAPEASHRHFAQIATLWRVTPDGYGGYTFAYPEEINCRWEERFDLLPGSSSEISKAVVYPEIAVSVEDYLYLGSSSSLTPVAGAYRVRAFSRIPNLRNLKTTLKAWLS